MKVSIDVKRFDPEKTNENTWVQNYKMDIHPSSTVLDALIHVREEIDGTDSTRYVTVKFAAEPSEDIEVVIHSHAGATAGTVAYS